jgi:hypothetical protein
MDRTDVPVNNHSPPVAKIALFRALFRGRDDVYRDRRVADPMLGSGTTHDVIEVLNRFKRLGDGELVAVDLTVGKTLRTGHMEHP